MTFSTDNKQLGLSSVLFERVHPSHGPNARRHIIVEWLTLLVADEGGGKFVNSPMLMITLNTETTPQLSENVSMMFELYESTGDSVPACYSLTPKAAYALDPAGCTTRRINVTHISCSCNHLTSFAILMSVTEAAEKSSLALDILSYICCSLSILFLFLSFLTFVSFKALESDRNTIHTNLVICLGLGQLVFLIGIDQVSNKTGCAVIAGFLHFLFLASFFWMATEGLQIYMKLVLVFETSWSMMPVYFGIGYGCPAIIVAISAGLFSQKAGWVLFFGVCPSGKDALISCEIRDTSVTVDVIEEVDDEAMAVPEMTGPEGVTDEAMAISELTGAAEPVAQDVMAVDKEDVAASADLETGDEESAQSDCSQADPRSQEEENDNTSDDPTVAEHMKKIRACRAEASLGQEKKPQPQGYGHEGACWLKKENGFQWSFIGPVLVVILLNVIMLSIGLNVMRRHMRSPTKQDMGKLGRMKTCLKGAVTLVFVLGLTWIFGIFNLGGSETEAFAYIFVLLNGSQGVFIFAFHCIGNDKVKKEYRRVLRRARWLPDGCRLCLFKYFSTPSSHEISQTTGASSAKGTLSRFKYSKTYFGGRDTAISWSPEPRKVVLTGRSAHIDDTRQGYQGGFRSSVVNVPTVTPTQLADCGIYLGEDDGNVYGADESKLKEEQAESGKFNFCRPRNDSNASTKTTDTQEGKRLSGTLGVIGALLGSQEVLSRLSDTSLADSATSEDGATQVEDLQSAKSDDMQDTSPAMAPDER
ncbi:adhesion G protein-coupled receptor L2-like [Littorina saxatilis]|uniref:adhesion G protein-coupled receptor L2-like n=1 Tax=Littorina saxatilis TaxID=31220 RepID=UPI0038B58160